MDIYLRFFVAFSLVILLISLAVWFARFLGFNLAFKLRGQNIRRLEVLDSIPLDTRRRLVLVSRDGVEYLLCVGGPTDLIIESHVKAPAANVNQQLVNQIKSADSIPRAS